MTWLRLDVRVERAPDLVIRAEPRADGNGWHVRRERSAGGAEEIIHGFLAVDEPVYDVHVG